MIDGVSHFSSAARLSNRRSVSLDLNCGGISPGGAAGPISPGLGRAAAIRMAKRKQSPRGKAGWLVRAGSLLRPTRDCRTGKPYLPTLTELASLPV
jgi:hypothetical protein